MPFLERRLQGVGDDVRGFVDVSQTMCFVDDYKVPGRGRNIVGFVPGELVRTDQDRVLYLKRTELASLYRVVVGLCFKNAARQEEFFRQLLMPLHSKV